jgi:chromosome segregation ATPase
MSPSEYQDLVAFLSERFAGIERRFEGLEQRFEGLERRFEGLHEEFAQLRDDMLRHFDQLYRRLERLEGEYQAIIQALRRIEARLADEQGHREILERDLAALRENVAVLGARIDEIERRLQA